MSQQHRALGRLLDVMVSGIALAICAIPCVIIACAVRLDSAGPILFRQQRIGRDGEPFELLKFRTMRPAEIGNLVTAAGESRITRVGAVLRDWKLDEIPQFVNVLRAEMSLVGPRPEVQHFVDRYPIEFGTLHTVRPGITDPATIFFRNEERVLQGVDDPERFYVEELLPEKIRMSIEYTTKRTFLSDIAILYKTFRAVLSKSALTERPTTS